MHIEEYIARCEQQHIEEFTTFTDLFALSMDYGFVPPESPDDPPQVEAYPRERTLGLSLPSSLSALPRPTLAWAESRIDRLMQIQVVFWALYPVNAWGNQYDMNPYAYLEYSRQVQTVRLAGLVGWMPTPMHTWDSVVLPYDWGDLAFDVPKAEAALNAVLEVCSDKVRAMPLTDQHVDALRHLGPSAAAIVDDELRNGARHRFVKTSAFELIGIPTLHERWRFCSTENWKPSVRLTPVSTPWLQ